MAATPFLRALIDAGLVDEIDAQALLQETGGRDFDVAKRLFEILAIPADRHALAKLYGDTLGKAYVPLEKTLFEREALDRLPPEIARRQYCIPVYVMGEALTLAMAHPEDAQLISHLEKLMGCPVSAVFAFPQEIENSIDIHYGSGDTLVKLSDQLAFDAGAGEEMSTEHLQRVAKSADAVELVRGLLLYCIQHNASDIHVQPMAKSLDVRLRIDGQLQTLLRLNRKAIPPVISRLKIMANLDISERRQPQDGRVSLVLRHRSFDFRLSTVPTVFGEKAVIRAIGSSDQLARPFDQLDLSTRNRQLLNRLIKRPNGVLFVTGPTGSGKTTTLYSALSAINRPEINIVTVEDPVELRIDGLTQIQTNAGIGLDFAKVLRAILRQDPQVVLIGEIRDLETARIAAQAAQTGHLVMATMHANNALQAVSRLIEIGVDPFLVAPAVIGVLAQRLVRRVCEHCKERYEPSEEVLDRIFYNRSHAPVYFYRGRGCTHCNHTGYAGRVAIHEIFILTDLIRELITSRAPFLEMQREAVRQGFRSMRYDGIMKAMQGLTTVEEVDRVTAE
ncbi:GspE/PulE family protein [Pseudothauera rhizosphaerae]|uniref:Type II/IV secretion system protein n=1 Tax=Pseudothauera rhizosphaerae TaxID=2565932 RepID=A0A4S4ALX8_9RHOO|nr:GspE/PulE family protein [Pseudothauera rhizosphaerae]THF60522.1 type II/IV secretion system protein [Pseudothauera rhizosphaerae]